MEFTKIYIMKGKITRHNRDYYTIYIRKKSKDITKEDIEKLIGKELTLIVLVP